MKKIIFLCITVIAMIFTIEDINAEGGVTGCAEINCWNQCSKCAAGRYGDDWFEGNVYDYNLAQNTWCEGFQSCLQCAAGTYAAMGGECMFDMCSRNIQ